MLSARDDHQEDVGVFKHMQATYLKQGLPAAFERQYAWK
jgi:hypothetical protein